MSEQEGSGRQIIVKVDASEEIRRLKQKNEQLENIVESLAQSEFEQRKEELRAEFPSQESTILDCESPSQLDITEKVLREEYKKPMSKGSVSLLPSKKSKGAIFSQEFDDPTEFVAAVKQAIAEEKNPEEKKKIMKAYGIYGDYQVTTEALKHLNFDLPHGLESEAVKDLGKNYSYAQYKTWLQKRMKGEQ